MKGDKHSVILAHKFTKKCRKSKARIHQAFINLLPSHVPIAYKLALIITLLISTGMILLGTLIVTNQTQLLRSQMNDFGQTVTMQLSESTKELVLSGDQLGLMVLVRNLGTNENVLGVVIYSDKGKVLASSGILPIHDVGNLLKNSQQTDESNYTVEWQTTDKAENPMNVISFITPIRFQELVAGHALITFSGTLLTQSLSDTIRAVVAATILMIILGIITSYLMGRRISRPIQNLMNASKAIDSGNFDYRIKERRNDEIGFLIEAFNGMAKGLLEKSQVESAFSRFVSTNVAKQILGNLDKIKLGGEHVDATALFADIVGFTSMSEKLSPKEVADLLNEYFSYIAMASRMYNGTIDKFMGDCAMLIFGVPEEDKNHKFNAVACAVLIQKLVDRLNAIRVRNGKFSVHFRIGINSGAMLAGNMGANERMQYTVVGEAVNLASRLHTVAESGQIIISEHLFKDPGVNSRVLARKHGSIRLRGISEPIATYIVKDLSNTYREIMDAQIDNLTANRIVA